ncbi:hypothetical protein GW943_00605 [Candidatus Parcubacteria bacterium]|uniref:DUF2065 domain-containing protein n=1 Tax=Candidatus Kaiserbacteria bacterium CG10_big_fil_rev_8_21_14_0_10_47_16 TaxID=1974608 RepID=A0A2H0UD68_9BACT|nr:hypothetical protein [Candidatus Parcubacteria bacterium]PIR84342.1 MAG: hypothetical protein COU16_01985 [Candidatus Kaiserbacteria bacterium CG10_big_fil_rev_8_21_14_0_10_47_16]
MDISIFLAQVFGLYFVITGIAMIVRPRAVETLIATLAKRDFIFVTGFVALFIGVPLVLMHNIWDGTWRVVVTVIVWAALLKGVMRLFMPDMTAEWGKRLAGNRNMIRLLVWAITLVGFYLLYVSF